MTRIKCCPPRTYAQPAPAAEVVYVPEVQTRTAIVLGIAVEIPLKPLPPRSFIKT